MEIAQFIVGFFLVAVGGFGGYVLGTTVEYDRGIQRLYNCRERWEKATGRVLGGSIT